MIPFTNLLPLLSLLAISAAEPFVHSQHPGACQVTQLLFGPVVLPQDSGVDHINLTLINFGDEVIDISSISVFGDINDGGGGDCAEENAQTVPDAAQSGTPVVLGPVLVPWPASSVKSSQITLLNFGDEVIDISSISVFGDINDGGACD